MCFKSFPASFFFTTKFHCAFCLDYVCSNCLCADRVFIPNELQLKFTLGAERICQEAAEFLSKFQFIRIDKRNPMLVYNQQLRRTLVLRRRVHKMFDMIQCNKWRTILELGGFGDHKNLVLKDCYLTMS